MSKVGFGFPNRADEATLSGGSYESTLPVTNLQERRPKKVARTQDDATASTQLAGDMGQDRIAKVLGVFNHNLSLDAQFRFRMSPDETFARADTGTYFDENGVITAAASGEARHWHHEYDGDGELVRTTLLEAARTNLVTSDDIENDWTLSTGVTVTPSQPDPAGGSTAFTVASDGSVTNAGALDPVSFTGDGVKSVVFVVAPNTAPASGSQRLQLRDTSAGANRIQVDLAGWDAGEDPPTPSVGAGTLLGYRRLSTGGWAFYCRSSSVTASNSHTVMAQAATSAVAGSMDVYRVNAYNATVPPTSILAASEVTTADSAYVTIDPTPREMTVYVRFIERGTVLGGDDTRLFQIGAATVGTDPRLYVEVDGGVYQLQHDGGPSIDTAKLGEAPAIGDEAEIRVVLGADASLVLGQSINGATETTAADASPSASLQSAWAAARLYLNSGGTSNTGMNAFISVKVAGGVKSMAEMRALEPNDADVLSYWQPYDTGWTNWLPAVAYPTGTSLWGQDRSLDTYSEEDVTDGQPVPLIHIASTYLQGRYFTLEFDDTSNTDEYVEAGRLFLGPLYEPTYYFSGTGDLDFGWGDDSTRTTSDGGAFHFRTLNQRRVVNGMIEMLGEDEAMVQVQELLRRVGTTKQVLFMYDTADTVHLLRRSFLAVLERTHPLKVTTPSYHTFPLSVVEEL